VKSIPVQIVLDAEGKVVAHVVGLRGEKDLRADIAKAGLTAP